MPNVSPQGSKPPHGGAPVGTLTSELENVRSHVAGSRGWSHHADAYWMDAPELDVCTMARVLKERGFRLITLTGLPAADGETRVIYHYVRGGLELNLSTTSQHRTLPSIANIAKPASWAEREVHDFFGLVFEGHPNLAPLLRPSNLEPGFFREPAASGG